MYNRIVAIENYWAAVIGKTDEFQQIAIAENPEFNKLTENAIEIDSFKGNIVFDHVWFAYTDENWILKAARAFLVYKASF